MTSHLKTLQLLLSVLLFSFIIFVRGQKLGGTFNGILNGTTLTTRNGRNIEAFLGIPYAEPPIGPLRFRNPVEAEGWDGIRDATNDGNQCPQINDAGVIVGDEDCLYLNVYTPGTLLNEEQTLFPTMVYIHGGDFVKGNGSSTMFGPEYLLDKDVVLVTINYRLGVLGFLSTGDLQAPGNFGLKDQVLALKWVSENIVFYRGDPDAVTLFGNGAGSVSAQLHSVSDASDGLFKQYISQSGTVSCFWAYKENNECRQYAKKLGEYLGCPTSNSKVLIDCLRMVDIYNLVTSTDIFNLPFYHLTPWGPTDEPALNGAFLTEYPFNKIRKNEVKDYPSIIGHVADEGLILTAQLYSNDDMYEKIVNNLDDFLLYITKVSFADLKTEKYVERIKHFFFNGTKPIQKQTFLKNLTDFISDTTFLISGAYLEESTISWRNDTAYLYSFDYRGTFSKTSHKIGSNKSIGVTHGDELMYLFPISPKLSDSDEQMIDIMVDLWTSFAYNGTPSTKQFSDPNFWQPYKDTKEYLIIGKNLNTSLTHQDNFHKARSDFWISQLHDQLFGGFLYYLNDED